MILDWCFTEKHLLTLYSEIVLSDGELSGKLHFLHAASLYHVINEDPDQYVNICASTTGVFIGSYKNMVW